MDVVTERAESVPGFLASPARPQSRIGGFRGRPFSGLPGLTHATSISASEMRAGFGADAMTSPTGMPSSEPAVSRYGFPDSLSSIGLPGEEAATFEPLMIEPYEPSVSVPSLAAAAGALPTSPDPPLSPLTPPTITPAPSASCPSQAASDAAAAAAADAAPASPAVQPKPPPGSALRRFASSRRSFVRQTSQVSGGAAPAAGAGRNAAVCAVASSVAEDGGKADAAAAVTAGAAPAAAAGGAVGGGGGSGGSAVPAAPRTPLPAVTDAPLIPPSTALSLVEVPVVVFDPTALPALPAAAAAAAGADGKATSSFLDPSKPAVRRLLPPLLRASQVLHDGGSADVSPTGVDEGSVDASGWPLTTSRCGGGGAAAGGCGAVSPSGGVAGPDGWTELQEALSTASPSAEPPLAMASLLCADVYDSMVSPRGGRRALPPMDPLRISATVVSLSASSTLEAAEAEPPGELGPMTSEPLSYSAASPGHGDTATTPRRGVSPRPMPWDSPGEAPTPEQRSWAGGISEAAGDGRGVPGDGYGGLAVMHRTASFHAVSSVSGCGGGSSSSNGHAANSQTLFDVARLRTRSAVMIPDLSVASLGGLTGVGGGSSSSSGGVGGSGSGSGAGRESGRLSRANSISVASPRSAAALAATTAAAAALPPIADRSGIDRRQTLTN